MDMPTIDFGFDEGLAEALANGVSKSETSREAYADIDMDVPQDALFLAEQKAEENRKEASDTLDGIMDEEVKAEKAPKVDTTDYTVPEGAHYVFLEGRSLVRSLQQLNPVIDLNSPRAVSRGISIRPVDNTKVDIMCPNELYYFKTTQAAENTLEEGKVIFVEYLFLTKIAKFLPPRILIYSKDVDVNGTLITKYFIRLTTGDLELINTTLIDADIKRLTPDYELTNEVLCELNTEETYRKVSTMTKLLPFESDSKRRRLHAVDNDLTFRSALLCASTALNVPSVQIDLKVAQYLMKACQLCTVNEQLKIVKTTSETLPRHAIVYGDTIMITNYADAKAEQRVLDMMSKTPATTVIDYSQLKYQLDYASSITYALGTVTIENIDGELVGKIKLQNGSESKVDITTSGDLYIPVNQKIRVNTKTLLSSLNALDPSLQTSIGFQDGILYLINSDIKLAVVTI